MAVKILIPDEMLEAAMDATKPEAHFLSERQAVRDVLQAGMQWLFDNPEYRASVFQGDVNGG